MMKARLKKVTGGTLVEIYSEQRKKWYGLNSDPMPRAKAVEYCRKEGFTIVRSD